MADYIEREAFMADAEKRYCAPCKGRGGDYNGVRCRACWVDDMIGEVADAPAADVAPVRNGKWNVMPGTKTRRVCSCCGWDVPEYGKFYAFCPNCGAMMQGEENE